MGHNAPNGTPRKLLDVSKATYVTDRLGHDVSYAIDSTKLQKYSDDNHRSSLRRVSRKL